LVIPTSSRNLITHLITQPHHGGFTSTATKLSPPGFIQPLPPLPAEPLLDLPIRAVDPSLRGGEVCDGCNLNSKPRLLLNW
jgi:hypothetical protein